MNALALELLEASLPENICIEKALLAPCATVVSSDAEHDAYAYKEKTGRRLRDTKIADLDKGESAHTRSYP